MSQCKECGGRGAELYQVCCGHRDDNGECCGDPDVEAEPCQHCNATGIEPTPTAARAAGGTP